MVAGKVPFTMRQPAVGSTGAGSSTNKSASTGYAKELLGLPQLNQVSSPPADTSRMAQTAIPTKSNNA